MRALLLLVPALGAAFCLGAASASEMRPRAKPSAIAAKTEPGPAPQTGLAPKTGPSAEPGAVPATPSPRSGPPIDTRGDLEIESDTLEVKLEEKLVVFSGNVDARQGEIRLQADQVRAYYDDAPKAAEAPPEAGAAGAFGDISRLEAEGTVRIATTRETARGERATYDVARKLITLSRNVVLTSKGSVVKGERLDFNLATGLINFAPATGGQTPGRVRGLFSSGTAPATPPTTPPP